MTFRELFEKWKRRIGKESTLLNAFMKKFTIEVERVESTPPDWQDREIMTDEVLGFYNMALNVLFEISIRFADSTNDEVYEKATTLGFILREILTEEFGIELEKNEIISPSRAMEKIGLIEFTGEKNGEQTIKLTDKGRELAREAEKLTQMPESDKDNKN